MDDGGVAVAEALLPHGEVIGGDAALDHQFTEPVAGGDVDHSAMSGVRIQGEHDPRGREIAADHLHDHDGQGCVERIELLGDLVGDGALGEEAGAAVLPVQDDGVLAMDVEVALALTGEAGLLRVLDRRRRAHGDVDLGSVLGAELPIAGTQGCVHVRRNGRVDDHIARELGPRMHLEVVLGIRTLEAALERGAQGSRTAHDLGLEVGQAVGLRDLQPGLPGQRGREEGPVGGGGGGETVGDAHSLRNELAVELT